MGKKHLRRGAKDWRKNIDVRDVEDARVAATREQLEGGPVEELPDERLFVIDKKRRGGPGGVERAEKRTHWDKLLDPNPFVPGVRSQPAPRQREVGKGLAPSKLSKKARQQKEQQLSVAARKKKSGMAPSVGQMYKEDRRAQHRFDVWADEAVPVPGPVVDSQAAKTRAIVSKDRVSERLVGGSKIGGLSYNPNFEDHQDLLAEAVAIEVEEQRAEEDRERRMDPTIENPELAERFADVTSAMLIDVTDDEAEDYEESDEEDDEDDSKYDPKRGSAPDPDRISRTERNKRKRKAYNINKTSQRQKILQREKRLRNLDRIKAELRKEEAQRQAERKLKAERAQYKEPVIRVPKRKPDLLLTEELPESLRKLAPAGAILDEQMNLLQRRGVLPWKDPQNRKKTKHRTKLYVPGTKGLREREMAEQIKEMRARRLGKTIK